MNVVASQQDAQPVSRLDQQLDPHGLVVFSLGHVDVLHRADVLVVAVVSQEHARDPQRRLLTQRHVDHAAQRSLIVVAVFRFEFGIPNTQSGFPRDRVDRTSGCIAAAQGPLRTKVHLHPLDIEKRRPDPGGTRHVDPVKVEGCGRIAQLGIVARSHTADPDFHVAAVVRNGQTGNDIVHVGHVLDAALLQVIAAESRSCTSVILHVLFTAFGSDDDLALAGFFRRFLLGGLGILRQRRGSKCAQ